MEEMFITVPDSLDGLEEAARKVLSEEEKLFEDIKEKILHARIRNEYRIERKKRGHGSGEKICEELAQKYFNNPDRVGYIRDILYRKY